jgi:hypothetical protein
MSNNIKATFLAALVYANAWFIFWVSGGHIFTPPAVIPSAFGFILAGTAYFIVKDYK